MFDAIEQAAYERARAAHLPHGEALAEARIAAGQVRAQLAQAQAAQAEAENPQPAFSWARFDALNPRAEAELNLATDADYQRWAAGRRAQLDAQVDALDREIEATLVPLRQRRQALIEEKNRL